MLMGILIRSWKNPLPRLAASAFFTLPASWLTPCAIYMRVCSCITPFIYLNCLFSAPPLSYVFCILPCGLCFSCFFAQLQKPAADNLFTAYTTGFLCWGFSNTKFIIFFLLASWWKRILLESLVCTLSLTRSLSAGEEETISFRILVYSRK